MKYILSLSVYLLFLFSFAGCGIKEPFITNSTSDHVLLVYMVTDSNGLDREALEKLSKLKDIKDFQQGYRLFVFSDTKFQDTGRLIEIKSDGTSEIVKTFGEVNSADKEQFAEVINYVVDSFASKSYGLMLFSHASGWLPKGVIGTSFRSTESLTSNAFRSVLVDRKEELSLSDFAESLPIKFDYIVFESCNMASVEVAYELKDKTKRIIGTPTQMISPGFTNIYSTLIDILFTPSPNFYSFVDCFYDHYTSTNDNVINLSVINTEKIGELATLIKSVNRSVEKPVDIFSIQQFDGDPKEPVFFFDFLDYYNKVSSKEDYNKIKNLLEQIVEYRRFTSQYYAVPEESIFPIEHFCGMSSYIPHLELLDAEYRKLLWYKATN